MKKQHRTLIVVAVAVLTAGLSSFAVSRVIQGMPVREVEVAHTQVVVAATNLTMGTRLQETQLKLVPWPEGSPVEGTFTDPQELLSRGLIEAVAANEPITERQLAPLAAGAGLSTVIPEGMRAISVRVNDVVGVAGFILPGSRVDVLVTVRDSSASSEPMTRTVVSKVQVLTAGTSLDQEKAKDGEPAQVGVVTLAVLPEDAERIALAQNEGRITLALRNMLDVDQTDTKGVKLGNLMSGQNGEPIVDPNQNRVIRRAPSPTPPPQIYRIETIRRGERGTQPVGE